MQVIAIVPLLMFGLVGTAVAIKLLMLARKTRELPEFAISTSILLMSVIGIPLCAAGRMPGNFGTSHGDMLFALGLFFAALGIEMTYVFCWSVFRRNSAWGRWVLVVSGGALLTIWCLIVTRGLGATELEAAQALIRPYAVALISMLVLASAWSTAEAFRYWGMQRRRLRIGLAEPVVVDRFLWWAISNIATGSLGLTMIAGLLMGKLIMRDPVSLVVLGVVGTVLTITWGLSFFPPKVYLRWVEGRASAS